MVKVLLKMPRIYLALFYDAFGKAATIFLKQGIKAFATENIVTDSRLVQSVMDEVKKDNSSIKLDNQSRSGLSNIIGIVL